MLNWLIGKVEIAKRKLEGTELCRLRTMREESVRRTGQIVKDKNLLTQGRTPAFVSGTRQSRNRAIGYWFLRGGTYTPAFALERTSDSDEFGFSDFPRF